MKAIKNIILKWLPVAAIGLAFAACNVAEDESDCVADMSLTFRFTKDGTDHFGVEVPSLSVFVYDGQNKFVGRWDENDNTKFSTDYTMTLPLDPGTYSFVVWGGLKDNHYDVCCSGSVSEPVVGESDREGMCLRVKCAVANTVDYVPSALFHGSTAPRLVKSGMDNHITVDLAKNTKEIRLTILGLPLPSTRANPFTQMSMWMTAANGGYTFDSNAIEEGAVTHTYHGIGADGGANNSLTASIHTFQLKLAENDNFTARPHTFTLWNSETGAAWYEEDILHKIINKVSAYNTQTKIDAEDLFEIEIDLTPNMGVSVKVNGWTVNGYGGDIQ